MFNPKKLPHNLEAEASVLGGIIADHDRLDLAEEYLCENDFYLQKNRLIFKNMVAMRDHHEVVDVLTLSERLKRQKVFNEIGGVTYLTDLVASVPLPSNYEGYCRIVHDNAVLRKLVETSASILNDCYGEYDQVTDLIDAAESKIFKVSQGHVTNDFSPAKDLLKETVENIRDCCENKGRITGVASGFKKLDACTSGFQRSDLIFLAARPSMGKTALALNIASHAALDEQKTVAVFSLEMSKKQLMKRLLCSEAGVDMDKVRKGEVDDTDWKAISEAAGRFYNSSLYIDDTCAVTLSDIRAGARRLKAEHGLDLIMIDYLQLIHSKESSANRYMEISEISRGLKALARELDCPIICLSQLSRAPETRADHHPVLADLRDSGSIEQDADMVLLLYREDYYAQDNADTLRQAELKIAKHRNGPTGKIDLAWQPESTTFTDLCG